MASNFVKVAYGYVNSAGIDTENMSVEEVIDKFKELSGGENGWGEKAYGDRNDDKYQEYKKQIDKIFLLPNNNGYMYQGSPFAEAQYHLIIKKIKELGESPEILNKITQTKETQDAFSKKQLNKLTKEKLLNLKENADKFYEERQKEIEREKREKDPEFLKQKEKKRKEKKEQEIRKIKDVASKMETSEKGAKKLINIAENIEDKFYNYVEDLSYVNDVHQNANGGGYINKSQSVRSYNDKRNGKVPLSDATKLLGVSGEKIKKIISPNSWHHTGMLYNITYFYDILPHIEVLEKLSNNNFSKEIIKEIKENDEYSLAFEQINKLYK